jgi:diacylglycerol kinase family enzyme
VVLAIIRAATITTVRKQRWLARLSILLIAGAVYLLIEFAGLRSLALIGFAALGICAAVAGAFWFLVHRGVLRLAALALAVLAPVAVAVLFARHGLLWVAAAVTAVLLAAVATAKAAMGHIAMVAPGDERRAKRPRRAFLIMNPRSGGGKVAQFGLREKAEALGARVALLDGPGIVDVAALAKRAVADGADLLGVAGGDGTQALVAGVAAEHGLPFLCISAGTRNHFAMDLGLNREDPATCLDALEDGLERRVDLGRIGDRTFVNNASFGVYAEIVRSPAYREDKRGTTLQLLPELMRDDGDRHKLLARAGRTDIEGPQAILVSNNPYELSDIAGLGRRDRLDTGELGVVAVKVANAAQAISLVGAGQGAAGLAVLTCRDVTVESAESRIPVGIDGETVLVRTPVHCAIQPAALRVLVPAGQRQTAVGRSALNWARLGRLAWFGAAVSDRHRSSYDGSMGGSWSVTAPYLAWRR